MRIPPIEKNKIVGIKIIRIDFKSSKYPNIEKAGIETQPIPIAKKIIPISLGIFDNRNLVTPIEINIIPRIIGRKNPVVKP